MKKLPLSIQTFAELIQEDYLFDKTRHIAELIQAGKYLFFPVPAALENLY
jgi:hypothetical protein